MKHAMARIRRGWVLTFVGAIAASALVACGGGDIQESSTAGSGDCGDFNIAVNPWVGYEADAYVVGTVAEQKLGCNVEYKNLKEEVSWQGFGTGEVDVVLENWGHPDLVKKYIQGDGTAVRVGPTGNKGVIGWYVPPWLAEAHPDITDWHNLNKYASNFETSESHGKGQLLDGDPSFVTNDEALVQNLNLDYEVVYAGSEAALIEAFRDAQANHEWVIGYFYEPQWFMSEVPLVKVDLPPYKPGCDANLEKVACDYPPYNLDKIASKDFMDADGPAAQLVQNFKWTNDDQNLVAKYIADEGMKPEDAAQKWIDDNPDKVDAWVQGIT